MRPPSSSVGWLFWSRHCSRHRRRRRRRRRRYCSRPVSRSFRLELVVKTREIRTYNTIQYNAVHIHIADSSRLDDAEEDTLTSFALFSLYIHVKSNGIWAHPTHPAFQSPVSSSLFSSLFSFFLLLFQYSPRQWRQSEHPEPR